MKKLLIVIVVVAAVVLLSVLGQRDREPAAMAVQVFTVIEQPIESTVLATGTLAYGDERRVRSEVNARVESVEVEEGDQVEAGQVLVRLNAEDYRNEVANQRTNVALREIDIERAGLRIEGLNIQLQRQTALFAQKAAQSSTIEDLNNQIAQAEVDLKMQRQLLEQSRYFLSQAEKQLAKTVIRAPVAGLVSALDIKAGEMAMATGGGQPLLTLVDPAQIYSAVEVDEADIGTVRVGQPVRVFAVAYLSTPLVGEVTRIATSARQVPGKNSLVFPVDVSIKAQDDVILRPGMSTRAEILDRSDQQYPVVPIEAIQQGGEEEEAQYYLFLERDGMAQKQSVELGVQDDRYQAVLSGLQPGDRVITGPYRTVRGLADGDAVQVASDD